MKKTLRALCMVMALLVMASCSWASYWNEGNEGYDEEHAYIIDSLSDFVELRDRVNSGLEGGNMYYKLNVLSKTINLAAGNYDEWEPIGTDSNPFTGHIDGNGHTIKVKISGSVWYRYDSSLFGTIKTRDGYAIKNLTVSGTVMNEGNGIRYAAGIALNLYNASIENCTFTGTVNTVGGALDSAEDDTFAGGIVEHMYSGAIRNCTVKDSSISVNASWVGAKGYAGGIVSRMEGGTVENCLVKTTSIRGTWSRWGDGAMNGWQTLYIGGITAAAGWGTSSTPKTIKDNTSHASVTAETKYGGKYLGGVIGTIEDTHLVSENNVYSGAEYGIGDESDEPGCVPAGNVRLTITKSSLADGTVDTAYSDTLTSEVSGVTWSPIWSLSSGTLPDGLSLDSESGAITGTPTKSGSSTFTVKAVLGAGEVRTATKQFTLKVAEKSQPVSLVITNESLAGGKTGTDYTETLKAELYGTELPATWTYSGTLPPGLALSTSGTLSGTPSEAGSWTFTVTAAFGAFSATKEFTIVIEAAPVSALEITGTLSDGVIKAAYSGTITAKGGTKPYAWTKSSGTLPTGLKLGKTTGKLTGTPTKAGTYTFKVKVTDKNGLTTVKTFTVKITAPSISGSLGSGVLKKSYSKTLKVTGGTSPYTWTKSSGTLPTGLKLGKMTGKLSGTPTEAGSFTFKVKVTDANGATATKSYTVTITKPSISGTLSDGVIKASYSKTLKASGGTSPYTWTKSSGTLPTGLKLGKTTGKLTGTPTEAGSFTFKVKVTDANGATATKSYTVTITKPTISGSLGSGTVSKSYSKTLKATGGTASYTWTKSSGTLPTGLKLGKTTGKLSGTPTKAGKFTFKIKVTDANGATATKSFTVTIKAASAASLESVMLLPDEAGSFAYSRTELRVHDEDILYQGSERDSDLVSVRAGEPVRFIIGEWARDVSDVTVCIDDEPDENITVSDEGTFTVPAEMVYEDFKVSVKAHAGESELESEELFITAE